MEKRGERDRGKGGDRKSRYQRATVIPADNSYGWKMKIVIVYGFWSPLEAVNDGDEAAN